MKEVSRFGFLRFFSIISLSVFILSLAFVIADSYLVKLPIQECSAEDGESESSGTWGSSCNNTYPGTALFNDDAEYEIHRVRKSDQKYWAGLRINSTNNSITECVSITEVNFCYKWWSETSAITDCDISIDADNGQSYTAITTTCPGTSEPGSITCTNVTSLENWTCSSFFGSGAFAKSEVLHDGTGSPGYYNITWDVFYFNVTYSNETTPPEVSLILPLNNTKTQNSEVFFKCNVTGTNLSNTSLYLWNSTGIYNVNTSNISGNANESNWTLSSIPDNNYEWNCRAYDTSGNNAFSTSNYSLVINSSYQPINFSDIIPSEDSVFNISDTIEIGVNITTENTIDSVYANITYPNSTIDRLNLSNTSNWYNSSFTIPEIIGTYNITFFANDIFGNTKTKNISFTAEDQIYPEISSTSISKTILYTAQKNKLSMEASDNLELDSCWLEITLPDLSTDAVDVSCDGTDIHYSNTVSIGTYIINFYVNDTSGNTASLQDSFETMPKIDFEYDLILVNTTEIINLTITNPEDDTVIYTNDSNSQEADLPDTVLDFEFKSYKNRFKAKLKSINLSHNNNKAFGMDKHFNETDYLVTYGINNSYNFTNATVTIYYDDLNYGSESNLRLYKCDDYSLATRYCSSSWYDISSSVTQNLSGDYFEFTTTSFSGFSIKEYTAPATGSSGGGGGSRRLYFYWNCSEWSECINNEQERECTRYTTEGKNISTQIVKRDCIHIEYLNISEEEIKKFFDTTLIIDELIGEVSGVLNAVVLLENFRTTPITIDLSFTVLNDKSNVIFNDIRSVIVEDILHIDYNSTDKLPDGRYKIILKSLHNNTRRQTTIKEIELGKRKGFSSKPIQKDYHLLNRMNIIGLIIIITISFSYLYFNKPPHKQKKR